MTTHDREVVIAAAKEAGIHRRATPVGTTEMWCMEEDLLHFYAIAFEAGRQAERVITIEDDDNLRFIKRVLESNNPAEADKATCLMLIHEIRSKARSTK